MEAMTLLAPPSRLDRLAVLARNLGQLAAFVIGDTGAEYRISILRKYRLLHRIRRNARRRGSASTFMEQVQLAQAVLNLPLAVKGAVAEFGAFKGMSSATLSLVCALVGRQLIVFDSFEGLPDPEFVRNIAGGKRVPYEKGAYAGALDEVKANIAAFGRIDVCQFVKGFFSDTLPTRPADERYALIFEDADLPSSVRDVIRNAWPRLEPGCLFFCHEARDFEVVSIFFDSAWWHREVGADAPGLIGSGLGLELGVEGSCLAYVMKPRAS